MPSDCFSCLNFQFCIKIIKVLCWAAAHRLAALAGQMKLEERQKGWQQCADAMRETIMTYGWNENVKSFTTAWGGVDVGPSLLRLAEVGFVKASDPSFQSTVVAFEANAALFAVSTGGHMEGAEQVKSLSARLQSASSVCFTASTLLWYAEALRATGRHQEARSLLSSLTQCANECGLLSQSIDLKTCELWGNFPSSSALLSFLRVGSRLSVSWRSI